MLKLIANIQSFGSAGYVASIDSIKGLVVQADTPQNAARELILSLKVKIALDYNIKIDNVTDKELETEAEMLKYIDHAKEGENEINLSIF